MILCVIIESVELVVVSCKFNSFISCYIKVRLVACTCIVTYTVC